MNLRLGFGFSLFVFHAAAGKFGFGFFQFFFILRDLFFRGVQLLFAGPDLILGFFQSLFLLGQFLASLLPGGESFIVLLDLNQRFFGKGVPGFLRFFGLFHGIPGGIQFFFAGIQRAAGFLQLGFSLF